jgi:hypothetical protein
MLIAAEPEFLLRCVRERNAASLDQLRAAAAAVSDWDVVVSLAWRNSVAAFVRSAIHDAAIQPPSTVVRRLRDEELSGVATVLLLDSTLERIAAAFVERSIAVIVLKGPVLARAVYARAELRPYGDLDLVVRAPALDAAAATLRDLGFGEITSYGEAVAPTSTRGPIPLQRRFLDGRRSALIDLHTDALQLGLEPLSEDDRWRRAVPVSGLPAGTLALRDDDQLIQLCVHVHKHGFERLIWLKDLDLFVRQRASRVDWARMSAIARREGAGASVWYALEVAASLLGTPVPADSRRLAPSAIGRALYRRAWPLERIASLEAPMHRRAVQFDQTESWRGMLPTLLFMGRRRDRLARIARHAVSRSTGSQPSRHAGGTG